MADPVVKFHPRHTHTNQARSSPLHQLLPMSPQALSQPNRQITPGPCPNFQKVGLLFEKVNACAQQEYCVWCYNHDQFSCLKLHLFHGFSLYCITKNAVDPLSDCWVESKRSWEMRFDEWYWTRTRNWGINTGWFVSKGCCYVMVLKADEKLRSNTA